MAFLAVDLISRSMRKAGILASGETASGSMAVEALDTLNDIIDQWGLEDLMIFYSDIFSFPLIANQIQYTIGPTGMMVVPFMPTSIRTAYVRTTGNLDLGVQVVSYSDYQSIIQKDIQSAYPTIIAFQNTIPNGNIYLWQAPYPGLTLRVELDVLLALIPDLATPINVQTGYIKAMVDALAYDLCLEYGRSEMLDDMREASRLSKMNIKRKNVKTDQMRIDPMFFGSGQGVYNIFSDTER